MANKFVIVARVYTERIEGKFASRDEIVEVIQQELESAIDGLSIDGIGADGMSTYEVTDYEIEVKY